MCGRPRYYNLLLIWRMICVMISFHFGRLGENKDPINRWILASHGPFRSLAGSPLYISASHNNLNRGLNRGRWGAIANWRKQFWDVLGLPVSDLHQVTTSFFEHGSLIWQYVSEQN